MTVMQDQKPTRALAAFAPRLSSLLLVPLVRATAFVSRPTAHRSDLAALILVHSGKTASFSHDSPPSLWFPVKQSSTTGLEHCTPFDAFNALQHQWLCAAVGTNCRTMRRWGYDGRLPSPGPRVLAASSHVPAGDRAGVRR